MAKFVCPECGAEMSNGKSSMVSDGREHMDNEHGKDVSRDYVRGIVDAHSS